MKTIIKIAALLFAAIWLGTGCTSMQSMSSYARTGDTVTIALGGSTTNSLVPVVKKENMTVTITDSSGTTYPLTLRRLFKVHADYSSRYAYATGQKIAGDWVTYNEPYQGQWMVVIDLIDPDTGTAPPLTEGMASFAISSPELRTYYYGLVGDGNGYSWANGDLASIPIEILAGVGTSNTLNILEPLGSSLESTHPVSHLEPLPQVQVNPSGTPSTTIGGAEFVLSYVAADFSMKPKIVPSTPDTNVQLLSNYISQGDGTGLIKVIILNQHGFKTDNIRSTELNPGNTMSMFQSLTFGVIWDPVYSSVVDETWQNSLQLVSGQYFDVDGNPMVELTPQAIKVR